MFVNMDPFFEADYRADGLAVVGKNLGFLNDPAFNEAWAKTKLLNLEGWSNDVPDIRWRAHVACWAVDSSLRACSGGDLAEFGVHTGIISLMLCQLTSFNTSGRKLYLFDTFSGIPELESLSPAEKAHTETLNASIYFDCFWIAERNFSEFKNVELVKGILPASLNDAQFESLCFAHFDLNNSQSEMAVLRDVWDRILPGGMILLDDYAWTDYQPQYDAWNQFSRKVDHPILTLPTGQGLIVKTVG
jgi:hypothetical protein